MKTRIAKYHDALQVVQYLRKNHEATGWGRIPFEVKRVRNMVVHLIRTSGMDVILAYDKAGAIRGLVLAQVDVFFWNGKVKYATDVHHISTGGGMACLRRFVSWGREQDCECVITAIATTSPRAEEFYMKMGFERRGGALVHWLNDIAEEAAA